MKIIVESITENAGNGHGKGRYFQVALSCSEAPMVRSARMWFNCGYGNSGWTVGAQVLIVVPGPLVLRDGAMAHSEEVEIHGLGVEFPEMSPEDFLALPEPERHALVAQGVEDGLRAQFTPRPAFPENEAERVGMMKGVLAVLIRTKPENRDGRLSLVENSVEILLGGKSCDPRRRAIADRLVAALGLTEGSRNEAAPGSWIPQFRPNQRIVIDSLNFRWSHHEELDRLMRLDAAAEALLARPEVQSILPELRKAFPRIAKRLAPAQEPAVAA